jgi:hypothetical protein
VSVAHVVWDNLAPRESVVLLPEQQLVMACRHCGDRYVAAVPASVGMVAAVCRQYVKEHRLCKPPREPKP